MTTFIKELCELLSCHCFIPKLLIPPIHPDFFLIETLIFFLRENTNILETHLHMRV